MKKKYLLTILFLVLYPALTKTFGQDKKIVDSLKQLIANDDEDTLMAKHLNDLVWYLKFSKPDTCLLLLDKSESLSKKLDFTDGLGNSFNNRAIIYTVSGNFNKALKYYELSLEQFKKNSDPQGIGFCYSNMAICYEYQSKFDSALILNKMALDFRLKNDLVNGVAQSNINIGVIYFNKGFYKLSLKHYMDALKYYENIQNKTSIDKSYLGSIQNNIGNIYLELKRPKLAKKYFDDALLSYKNNGDKREIGYLYNDLGGLKQLQGDYQQAIKYYNKALELSSQTDEISMKTAALLGISTSFINQNVLDSAMKYANKGLNSIKNIKNDKNALGLYLNIGDIYMLNKNWTLAIQNYQHALKISDSTGIIKQTDKALFSIAECYSNIDSIYKSNYYLKQYIKVSDSILSSEKHKQITEMEALYENDKKTLQLAVKEADNRELKNKNKIQLLIIIMSIIIVFSLILFFLYGHKLQKAKLIQIEQENEIKLKNTKSNVEKHEKKRLAGILHDNIAHLVSIAENHILEFIKITTSKESKDRLTQVVDNLKDAHVMIKVASYELEFSLVLEKNIVDQFNIYINKINHGQSPRITFNHNTNTEFDDLSGEVKINLFSVFQEMLGNAIKYAKATTINISLIVEKGTITLQVDDDGIGFNYDKVRHGMGLKNMKERAEKLGGRFVFESEVGFGSKFVFVV